MTKRKPTTAAIEKIYTVRIAVSNEATGKDYKPGDTVTAADFPLKVIKNWLDIDPAVLEVWKETAAPELIEGTEEEE